MRSKSDGVNGVELRARAIFRLFWLGLFCSALSACGDSGLALLSGGQVTRADTHHRWIAINYWATWCAPCRDEVPELNALDQSGLVRVIGINFDQLKGDALEAAVTSMGIQFDVLVGDPQKLWPHQPPQALPATLLISPDGQIAEVLVGPQTRASLSAAIDKKPAIRQSG